MPNQFRCHLGNRLFASPRHCFRPIGISNVTPTQVADARKIVDVVCVQNVYNIAHQHDDTMIDESAPLRRCSLRA
jgi:hypothetical protein